jgi:uncharacterized protein
MVVVSNTSPISNLAIIGRLEFLRKRYSVVHIPSAVEEELGALSHSRAAGNIVEAIGEEWIHPHFNSIPSSASFLPPLDRGEEEAINLACHLRADILLIDERPGRTAARKRGLSIGGVLGELIFAKNAGWIASVRNEIIRLRHDAGFFVDPAIEQFVLSEVGE